MSRKVEVNGHEWQSIRSTRPIGPNKFAKYKCNKCVRWVLFCETNNHIKELSKMKSCQELQKEALEEEEIDKYGRVLLPEERLIKEIME